MQITKLVTPDINEMQEKIANYQKHNVGNLNLKYSRKKKWP